MKTYLSIVLFLFLSIQSLVSQIQKTAFAQVITDIVIDGNLDDWPNSHTNNKLDIHPFGGVESEQDLKATFRIGHNKNTIYVAIEIQDEFFISLQDTNDINAIEGLLLYIDPEHGSLGGSSLLFEIGDTICNLSSKPTEWNNTLENYSLKNIQHKIQRERNTTTYELSIELNKEHISNRVFGFDLIVIDQDKTEDESSWTLWKEGTGKSESSTRLGQVVLIDSQNPLGTIQGQVKINDSSINMPQDIICSSTINPDMWLSIPIDSFGNYKTEIPAGEYKISPKEAFTTSLYDEGFNKSTQRIEANSVLVKVLANKSYTAKDLVLNRVPIPSFEKQSKGALFQDTFDKQDFEETVNRIQAYYKIPGTSIAVIKDGQVVYNEAHGVKNNLTKDVIDNLTLFEAASITKSVFATIALKQVELGLLDLDKPLYEYLRFPNIEHDERYTLLTARHVLNHQSGLDNWSVRSYLGYISDVKAEFQFSPGTDYNYSGEAMNYLGRVISHLTKKPLYELFQEDIMRTFGMDNSYFHYRDSLVDKIALGHYQTMPFYKIKFTNVDSPASSMFTNADDFSKFMLGLIHSKYLAESSYALISTPYNIFTEDDKLYDKHLEQSLAHGFFTVDLPEGRMIGHGGNNGDYDCKYGVMLDQKCGYVIFTNSSLGDEFIRELEMYLLHEN